MASPITTVSAAILSSTTLVPSAFATVAVVTPQNASAYGFSFFRGYVYDWLLPMPFPGVLWTVQQALSFGILNDFKMDYSEERSLQVAWLTPAGCFLDSGSVQTRNCSESCVQAASIFDNTSTLANCMALPLIINMTAAGNLSKSDEDIAKSYGIGGNRSLALLVNSTLSNCFQAYCRQSKACTVTPYRSLFQQGLSVCEGVDQTVLGDIAGIGVRIIIDDDLQDSTDNYLRSMLHIGYRAVSRFRLGYCS